MRAVRLFILITLHSSLFMSLPACAGKTKGKSTLAVYQEALGEGTREGIEVLKQDFKREQPLGYEEPVVPVMSPPETMLVWFANQKIGDEVFVHGHWVQIVIRPWEWNPDILNSPAPSPRTGGQGTPFPLHPESKPKNE
ncbi:MAG: hypothetical protein HYT87_00035 [Nitrospirae bacterium]|nr:hypothetical protein [Nitrospirota bacterium]